MLIVSTDPTPSLRATFQLPASARGSRSGLHDVATARGTLQIMEIDGPRALQSWLGARREMLQRIALRGTWLDEADVASLLRLSLPGIDEIAALLEIARLGRAGRFDLIVVDTAPTGHALRMLAMPGTLLAIARVFDRMQEKHRVVVEALRGRWTVDDADLFISELDRDARDLDRLLRDQQRARLSWITLPEPMAVEESADALERLRDARMGIERVIVNRVTPKPLQPCRRCRARRALEHDAIGAMTRIAGQPVTTVRARDREPRGVRALGGIGAEIAGEAVAAGRKGRPAARWIGSVTGAPTPPGGIVGPATRLLMFGGKGGTGKTTCAAAVALMAARAAPDRRVLLLSADPAHSLGDVLGAPLSDAPSRVAGAPPNLEARELDAARQFEAVRERYASAVDALFDRVSRGGAGVDVSADRHVVHGLIDLAPPGIDELGAVVEVADSLEAPAGRGVDLVVVDTAPGGHALRLLEMPALAQDWARALMSILLKYQPVVGAGDLGAMLLKLSQGLGRLRALLADAARSRLVVVTRPAALPRAETMRMVARLRGMGIHVPSIIVNSVGRGTCRRCRAAAAAECREIALLRRSPAAAGTAVVLAPVELPPPLGPADLRRWSAGWRTAGSGREG